MSNDFDSKFHRLMKKKFMQVPKKWTGDDFIIYMINLYDQYKYELKSLNLLDERKLELISNICKRVVNALKEYYNGKPAKAYNIFAKVMEEYKYKDNSFIFY